MATEQELKDILGKAQGEALAVLREVQREVVGKDGAILRILLAMLARGHVLLAASAILEGNLTAATLSVEEGAALEGTVTVRRSRQ